MLEQGRCQNHAAYGCIPNGPFILDSTTNIAYIAPIKESDIQYDDIFFNEALAVVSALEWAAHLLEHPHQILIQTNSMNMVNIWHSLAPLDDYALLLLYRVEIMMDYSVDVWVTHIPGTDNMVTNALSRSLFDTATNYIPDLQISSFTPPCEKLGVKQGNT